MTDLTEAEPLPVADAGERGDTLVAPNPVVRLPYSFAKRFGAFVDYDSDGAPALFCRRDAGIAALAEARRVTGLNCPVSELADSDFELALASTYEQGSGGAMAVAEGIGEELDLDALAEGLPQIADLLEQEDDAPVIRLINAILSEAVRRSASDIHIETFEHYISIRLRIDGVLQEILRPRREIAPLLVSRIKVMARLDIAEKRVPQDGRISLRLGGREVDIRVSTMPSSGGERVVLRLLDKQAGLLSLEGLGLGVNDLQRFGELLRRPYGIVLVTGPTGSGKTTTLYAALNRLNDATRNILTVEDPIEYNIDGIGQTQVHAKTDMTFARGLRAILRQDPDVVMIGEIRDLETAEIAVQASLTGHLVLSTLHTNTAVGAITRLEDMGIEPFLLSSSLMAVMAQRLVRRLCPDCKEPYVPSAGEMDVLGITNVDAQTLYHPAGCVACNQQGYRGRMGIYEFVVIDDDIRRMVHDRAAEGDIVWHVRKSTPGIRADGFRLVRSGLTTTEEVIRVTREE